MKRYLNWRGLAIIFASTLAGCAIHVQAPNTPDAPGNAEITQVKGKSEKGTAFVTHVDGQQVLSEYIGYAASVTIHPGPAKLTILCQLDGRAMTGTLRPFDKVGEGMGVVTGTYATGAYTNVVAQIRLNADLKSNARYELHCEPIGDFLARAWLVELK